MSFDEVADPALDDAVQRVIDDGVTVVVAAGNSDEGRADTNCGVSPAENTNTIRVGGVQARDGQDFWYEGGLEGSCIDLLAPAYGVTTTNMGGGTGQGYGTSEATAMTSGAAALVLQRHPSWTPGQVKDALLSTASTGVVDGLPDGVPNRLLDALAASQYGETSTPVRTVQTVRATTAPAAPASTSPASATTQPSVRTQPTPLTGIAATAAPRLSGTARVGSSVATDQGRWNQAVTLTTRWYRVSGSTRTLVGTGARHAVVAADQGRRLQACTTASATGRTSVTACSGLSWTIAAAPRLSVSATPTISGSAHVGRLVRAVPRTWGPAPVTLHYQWYRVAANGHRTAIARATGVTYRLTTAELGQRVQVLVSATKAGYQNGAAWSVQSVRISR